MSAAITRSMTLQEFLDWESQQEFKYEYDGVGPVAMTGVSLEHAMIQVNLIGELRSRLRGGPCQVIGNDLKISVAGRIRYPDVFVFCSPLARGTLVVEDPVVVFEIASPGTASTDAIHKNAEYRDTRSIQRYVMLAQDRRRATVFARVEGDWVGRLVDGDAVLSMPEIGVDLSLADIYEGITFPE